MTSDYDLSRTLSKVLRHEPKAPLDIEGWAEVSRLHKYLVQTRRYSGTLDEFKDAIRRVVSGNDKQRFKLQGDYIRANQGHSAHMKVEVKMKRIRNPDGVEAIHGTTRKAWTFIETKGLDKMTRQHIHFAPSMNAISGIRKNAEILIHLDVRKWLEDGHALLESENGVILTWEHVDPKYFLKVEEVKFE
jgi:2'-phosphotransferase